MKIKITDLRKLQHAIEIVRDLGIKQPTFGYTDILKIPKEYIDEIESIFKKQSISFEIINESLTQIIKRVIREHNEKITNRKNIKYRNT